VREDLLEIVKDAAGLLAEPEVEAEEDNEEQQTL